MAGEGPTAETAANRRLRTKRADFGFEFRDSGFGFRVSRFGFRVSSFGYRGGWRFGFQGFRVEDSYCEDNGGEESGDDLISQTVFMTSFRENKYFNIFFLFIKDDLTHLCGNWLLPHDSINTLCEIRTRGASALGACKAVEQKIS